MPVDKALQLIDLLDEHQIHGLMYVDDAMLYEHPTGHVVRTSRWAQTLPPEQRPTFTQVSSLAQAARDVNAVWKFALTDEDIPRLQRFGQHVEQALGPSANGHGTIRWISRAKATVKASALPSG